MKFSTLIVGVLAGFTPLAAAWSKEDHEIFRVRDELSAVLGPDVTFYDFLGVPPSASIDDINRGYRKKSRTLHPDKVKQQLRAKKATENKGGKSQKGVRVTKGPTAAELRTAIKQASDMQARLGLVANILRGPERDRYDHFLSHGFPVWKGTGYYYNRFRPGLGSVLVGLFVFVGGGAHYLTLYMSWKRQREFVDRYIRYARQAAWGNSAGVNLDGIGAESSSSLPSTQAADAGNDDDSGAAPQMQARNRKERRMQERDAKREAAKEAGGSGRRGAGAGAGRRLGGGGGGAAASRSGTATPAAAPADPANGPIGNKKRVVAQNGKILVVDSKGNVYLEETDEDGNVEEFLLDIDEVAQPTIRDTAVYRFPVYLYQLTIGRALSKKADDGTEGIVEVVDSDSSSGGGVATPATDSNEEFELVDKSTESLAKASGSQNKAKANKRRGKKR